MVRVLMDAGAERCGLSDLMLAVVFRQLDVVNAMLEAEADRLCGAGRYERSDGRKDTRAGSYERSLDTKAGPVKLKMPKIVHKMTGKHT